MAATEHDVVRSELRWAVVSLSLSSRWPSRCSPPWRCTATRRRTSSGSTRRPCISPASSPNPTSGPGSSRAAQVTTRIVATQFAFVPQCVVVPEGRDGHVAPGQPRRDPRHPGHRHQRQHDGRARLCQPGAHGVSQDRRSADAVPRILRPRAQPDARTRAGRAGRAVPTRRPRESELCRAIASWSSRIFGSPSLFSPSPRCSASGRCGCAARCTRPMRTRRIIFCR